MTAAVIGLIGVFLGALGTQIGVIVADRRQVRIESARWRRDQKAAAYDGAIRHLLRAANRRSELAVESGILIAVLGKEQVREVFDDVVEAQFWLHTLVSRCGSNQAPRIREAATLLDEDVRQLAGSIVQSIESPKISELSRDEMPVIRDPMAFMRHSPQIIKIVTDCAREDMGTSSQ